jgi:hypothetical protein
MPHPGCFTPGKDPVLIVQENGLAPGLVWTSAENLAPSSIRSPDHSPCSHSLYLLQFLGKRVQIPLNTWMFVVLIMHCAGSGICDKRISQSEGSYSVCVCVCSCLCVCVFVCVCLCVCVCDPET